MIVLIVAFYLLREHWGHVFGLWPYLLLLACPLMHLFMCRGKKQEANSPAAVPADSAEH